LGAEFEREALKIASQLRSQNLRVDFSFGGRALKGAMKAADKSGARYAFVLGERESQTQEVEIKELSSGKAQSIRLSDLSQFLTRSLSANA
jgi:histidyl-tRNA synthetase